MKLTPQDSKVLDHLRSGKSLTQLEALGVYGIFRLAARVWSINNFLATTGSTERVNTRRMRDAKKKSYARYTLGVLEGKPATPPTPWVPRARPDFAAAAVAA